MLQQNVWLILGSIGFLGYVPSFPPETRLLNLCFFIPFILRTFQRRRISQSIPSQNQVPLPQLPLPPVAKGVVMTVIRSTVSTMLCFIVPSMLRQIIRHIYGQSIAEKRGVATPDTYQQQVRYRLPFDGTWYVANGGVNPATSHSWEIVGQRYAYDFIVTDEMLRRWQTDGTQVTDYLCYDLPILAPADGEVVAVVEGVRDAPKVGTGWIDVFTSHFPGNAVTIRHAEGEYSFLAHLIPQSVCVKVGETVKQGQVIGRCGNSGHSTEPHLHFHVQDHIDFFQAAGLPIAFDAVSVNGSVAQNNVYLTRGTQTTHSSVRDV